MDIPASRSRLGILDDVGDLLRNFVRSQQLSDSPPVHPVSRLLVVDKFDKFYCGDCSKMIHRVTVRSEQDLSLPKPACWSWV